jgi:pimeloyl-ACP methyl ester carboxylesterase
MTAVATGVPGSAAPESPSFHAGWRHRGVIANGLRLHVVEAGPESAPAVVLLHGFPEFWYAWREQIDPLQEAGYRVIAVDQRGYNLSDKPRGVSAYQTRHQVADVVGLLDALGLDRVDLVAHDWGAHVAWTVAEEHPERLRRLVILNVAHPQVMTKNMIFNPRQTLKSWYVFAVQVPKIPEWVLGRRAFAMMHRFIHWDGEKGPMSAADRRRYTEAWSRDGAFTSMLNWYRAALRSRPRLERPTRPIQVPVLLLWGTRDRFLDPSLAQQSLALCKEARLVTFPEGSHWIHHEVPSQVNREILAFLGPARE